MARPKAVATRPRRRAGELGAGLHPAIVEMTIAEDAGRRAYRVRLPEDRRLTATLAAGVAPSFIDACMREGRSVVLMDTSEGVAIAGALQTDAVPAPVARGTLSVDARHIRLRAAETLELEVPGSSLRVEPGGVMRLEGDRLVIDMAALVRIFSAKVEVP